MENTKKSRADWLVLVRAWEDSGLSQRAFCHAQGLKLASFGYWRTQYLKSLEPEPGFVGLEPESQSEGVKLRVGGVELELAADANFVADVLINLAGRC
jgi:hypothetical protein